MELLAVLLVIGIVSTPVFVAMYRARQKELKNRFIQVAEKTGLEFTDKTIFKGFSLDGSCKGFPVKIQYMPGSKNEEESIKYEIGFSGKLPEFTIKLENVLSNIRDMLGREDIKTFDQEFDDLIFVKAGDVPYIIGLLNLKLRKIILDFGRSIKTHKWLFKITNSGIKCNLKVKRDILSSLETLILISEELHRPGYCKDFLTDNFLNETDDEIQRNNLKNLFENFSYFERKEEIMDKASGHKNPFINALYLKQKEKITKEEFDRVWNAAPPELRMQMAGLLLKTEAVTDNLILYYKNSISYDIKKELLITFKKAADISACKYLLRLLNSEDNSLKNYIIKALGTCGTIDAVEPLLAVKNLANKRTVEEAVAEIQSGLDAAEKGSLTITELENDSGNLSIK